MITGGPTFGTNSLATTSSGVPPGCLGLGADVWYSYTPSASGTLLASLCPLDGGTASFDTILRAFSGPCGALVAVACNDDNCGYQSRVFFSATSGTTYYISVGGFAGATGNFTLSVSLLPPPTNDECSNPIPIGQGLTPGTTIGASQSAGVYQGCGQGGPDVWYAFTPTASATQSISVNPMHGGATDFLAILRVFSGGCASVGGGGYCTSSSFPPFYAGAWIWEYPVTAGQTYLIEVAASSVFGTPGSFVLSLPPPPANDVCGGATPLHGGINGPFSNLSATDGPSGSCGSAGTKDVWFSYSASITGFASVDTCGLAPNVTTLDVYSSCGGPMVACDNSYCDYVHAKVLFSVVAGNTYYIRYSAPCPMPNAVQSPNPCEFRLHVSPEFSLAFSTTGAPGNVTVVHSHGIPSSLYFTAVSFNWAGNFPNGWLYGIDIPGDQLQQEVTFGPPFVGILNSSGAHVYSNTHPALSGVSIYAVAIALDSAIQPVEATAPVHFVIP